MISQLFILSNRGDTIITRDFRGELIKSTHDIFFRKIKSSDTPPFFKHDGVHFTYIRRGGLYVLATSPFPMPPTITSEFLSRAIGIIKDFLGVFTEESIRKNFVLVYEILDELIDFGYYQSASTDQVRSYLVNEPVIVGPTPSIGRSIIAPNSKPPTAVHRPLSLKKQKNEIFVDIIEKLSVVFSQHGHVISSGIDGCIQMKSYIEGKPYLRLGLNEDLIIGQHGGLVDYNFHEIVDSSEFESYKILGIYPHEGEFIAMNYRLNADFSPPFRVTSFLEEVSAYKLELFVKVSGIFPDKKHASNFSLKCKVPQSTLSINFEKPKNLAGQECEFKENEKIGQWTVKKFPGGTEQSLKMSVNVSQRTTCKEIGPVSLNFDIPMYSSNLLTVKYLRLAEKGPNNPTKWVRYMTQSSSYICRIT